MLSLATARGAPSGISLSAGEADFFSERLKAVFLHLYAAVARRNGDLGAAAGFGELNGDFTPVDQHFGLVRQILQNDDAVLGSNAQDAAGPSGDQAEEHGTTATDGHIQGG